ncbi:pilus assembly protein [Peristeroidobacter agariperforans]|uniref:pilus assembly protein n=1 Tax=Peristeroidobacter agariperforans TaxID=268404 RepID=UPI00101BBFB1|nr:PilC/PilY family type IV pilus protein [Peristeroidobacter agariperforans]
MNRSIQWTSSHLRRWVRVLTCGCVTAAAMTGTARADDSEIYINQSVVAPNIMLILDTSGSMNSTVSTQQPFDPSRKYVTEATGACNTIAGRVFYATSGDRSPPTCDSTNYVPTTNQKCQNAETPLTNVGSYQTDRFTQWRGGTNSSWQSISNGSQQPIDCRSDSAPYPRAGVTGPAGTPSYTNNYGSSYWDDYQGTRATLYSADYVAYYNQFRNYVSYGTRLSVMQQAARSLLTAVTNVNVGLMRYSTNVQYTVDDGTRNGKDVINGGGMVLAPVAPIADNRAQLIEAIDKFVPHGNTPLSETLYEAHQYFAGKEVYFGVNSEGCTEADPDDCDTPATKLPSVASSRVGGTADSPNYASPANQACQKNYIVYLTDGEPTQDAKANSLIAALLTASPGTVKGTGCPTDAGSGQCLGALSEYMFNKDLISGVGDTQNVTTYYIGFGDAFGGDSNPAFTYLNDAALRGGGKAYKAGDLSGLTAVFSNIFDTISENSATLTAPTVAVNAFNRTQTLNDLYISVFQPSAGIHWPGNIKKYKINPADDKTLWARGDTAALGEKGMFLDSTSDYWSTTNSDGSKVGFGGAGRQIPAPASRNVYTHIGANPTAAGGVLLTNDANAVHIDNDLITDATLGTNATAPLRDTLIDWARGADVDDLDKDKVTDEQRYDMGDPMHSQPAVVIYGGTKAAKNQDDAVVFTATNDGYVHAFETTTGNELWSFIPQEMLPGLKGLYQNENSITKNYAIDGDLRVLKYDVNGDGIVTPSENDRVLLFFSTGRNPTVSRYYALDITEKTAPRFLWAIGDTVLPGLAQAWSRGTVSRVNISGADQNSQKLVLIFGGGYDPIEEGGTYVSTNATGNRVYIVDALRGTLLWSAGKADTDLNLARMTHSIPSPINVVDLDGDSFADRLYVGDMAAQLWRFDIFNGQTKDKLVTGGVIASLGAKDAATQNAASTRRFYNSPDSSLMQGTGGRPFINIAIGSGYRGHPLATTNEDRFYSVRDYQPFAKLEQTAYTNYDIVLDTELDDITTNFKPTLAANSPGWKLQLNYPSYQGEKVLSSSSTLQNVIFFTSYTPSASATSNTCSVAVGSNRVYAIKALDGSPLPRRDSGTNPNPGPNDPPPPPLGAEDRYDGLDQQGIAPEVTVLFPEQDKITCLSGVEVLSVCRDFNSRIKTYWRQTNAN